MHVSSHAIGKESCTDHKENNPPIEPDQPPPDDKISYQPEEATYTNNEKNINSNILSTKQLEQTCTALKEDDRSNDVPTTQEQVSEQKTKNQQGTSSTVSLDFLKHKMTKKQEEVDEFLLSLNLDQLKIYNELAQMGYGFDEIKTIRIQHEDFEFNKNDMPYLAIL